FTIWRTAVLLNRSSLLISTRLLPAKCSCGVTFKRFIIYVGTYMRNSTIVPITVDFGTTKLTPLSCRKLETVFGTAVERGERLRKYVGADILACEGQDTDGREEESNAHNQSGRGTGKARSIDTQDRPHHVQAAGRPACNRREITNASRHSAAGAKGVSGSGRGLKRMDGPRSWLLVLTC